MALNKYMHPRNIYKTPPNFVDLAKCFAEFSKIAAMDVTGKVTIDFKNPHSLRVLTKCLLKKDFNLDVIIPEDRLVPTLPLRLNYILWVEDLMAAIGRKDGIRGLDIGTGACAVYPLLAAVKNKWHMIGTESDEESFNQAKDNVERNNLQDLIELIKSSSKSLLEHVFSTEDTKMLDFSMCNPPFYSNMQELCESRSPARLPPKNAFTGSPQELITDGGELAFCRKMIQESKALHDQVMLVIFTTMVGHKYNLKELEHDLRAEGMKYTSTEFCQGRVTRWGLAWTYQNFDIAKLVPPREKTRKPSVPVVYVLPEIPGIPYDVENASRKVKSLLQTLNIHFKVLNKRGHLIAMDIKAMTNTWSNQRRKRRLMKKIEGNDCKKIKPNASNSEEKSASEIKIVNIPELSKTTDSNFRIEHKVSNSSKGLENNIGEIPESTYITKLNISKEVKTMTPTAEDKVVSLECRQNETISKENIDTSEKNIETVNNGVSNGRHNMEAVSSSVKEEKPNNSTSATETPNTDSMDGSSEAEPVVHAILKVLKKENEILLEMEFLDGSSGKEGVHQIVQYIKNNWK